MNNKLKNPLLSICIPTWNRANFLKMCLDSIKEQLKDIDSSKLEILISDNCSTDSTSELVNSYINGGMSINYNRNDENIGFDKNFLKCAGMAIGKYVIVAGDDDVLLPGSIQYLLDILVKDEWGLVHISANGKKDVVEEYDNSNEFLKRINHMITFMTANIFRSDIVSTVVFPEKFNKSWFMYNQYYFTSIFSRPKNIVLNKPLFKTDLDSSSNGGYNLYEVFVKTYLEMWHDRVLSGDIPMSVYKYIRKEMLLNYIVDYNYNLLIRHKNVCDFSKDEFKRGGWSIDHAWSILFHYYGKCWYFYYSLLLLPYKGLKDLIKYGLRLMRLRK